MFLNRYDLAGGGGGFFLFYLEMHLFCIIMFLLIKDIIIDVIPPPATYMNKFLIWQLCSDNKNDLLIYYLVLKIILFGCFVFCYSLLLISYE